MHILELLSDVNILVTFSEMGITRAQRVFIPTNGEYKD